MLAVALDLVAELEGLVDALDRERIDYALCGGLAVTVHGHVRATKDIDLLIRSEDLARIRALVATLGYDLEAAPMTFGAGTDRERRVHRISKADPDAKLFVTLDLVVLAPIYAGVWQERVRVSWRDRTLACVSRDGLLQMKRIAGRPQDLADIHALEGKGDDGA